MNIKTITKLACFALVLIALAFLPAYTQMTYTTMYTVPFGEFQTLKIHKEGRLEAPILRSSENYAFYIDPDKTSYLETLTQNPINVVKTPVIRSIEKPSEYFLDLRHSTASTKYYSKLYRLIVSQSIIMYGSKGTKSVYGVTPNPMPDISEGIATTKECKPCDVVVIDEKAKERVTQSTKAYDSTIAGIIAQNPFLYINKQKGLQPLALAGRVFCHVTGEGGPIKRGDLLVSSSTPGHAMKADLNKLSYGMVIGKALQPFKPQDKTTQGKILVLVNLQ